MYVREKIFGVPPELAHVADFEIAVLVDIPPSCYCRIQMEARAVSKSSRGSPRARFAATRRSLGRSRECCRRCVTRASRRSWADVDAGASAMPNATTRPEMAESLIPWDMRHPGASPGILDAAWSRVKTVGSLSRATTGIDELEQRAGVRELAVGSPAAVSTRPCASVTA